ncbi:TPA: hypothetical protein HA265_05795, partial [Candidatus Woesearchaeota archaeon]|nr:hypothetical protein [Candidatus Woesearchaeota archaeon]
MKNKQARQKTVHVLNSEIHSIKAELHKTDHEIRQHIKPDKPRHAVHVGIMLAVLFILLGLGALFFQGSMTGWIVSGEQYTSHSQELGWNITGSQERTLLLEEHPELFNLRTLELSGHAKGEGRFTIYLEDTLGRRYLVMDQETITTEGLASATAYLVNVPENEIVDESVEQTPEETAEEKDKEDKEDKDEETGIDTVERTIMTVLEYNAGTQWDPDDDGVESVEDGVVDLTVAQSGFSWAVDESKLCTKWTVSSVESGIDTTVCNGAVDCCSLLAEVAPEAGSWDEPLYVFHGKYGATEENVVRARVIFLNQSIGEETYFESTLGTEESIDVRFVETSASTVSEFADVCVESCILPAGLNTTDYTLVFDLDEGVELFIESMTYALENLSVAEEPAVEENVTVDVTPAIKDSRGTTVPAVIEFYDETGELKSVKEIKDRKEEIGEEDKVSITRGNYKVKIRFTDKTTPVESIEFNDVSVSENTTEFVNVDDVAEFGEFVEVYAIDPTAMNFTNATVTMTAKGNSLYKCKEWDFAAQECHGTWTKLMDITPGQEYTFVLTPEDPAYAETLQPNATEGIDTFINQNQPN